ncbi:MAG: hypothetical protein OQJ89_09395 [Kangiellaceae bacterium]|nr:hypothetical protein [Kangiellaceae bacterium]MCW8999041.1 hypothetical protein [Kangiellaceae bacterium]MCW9017167.1 hypothetical protein [Kangiellaceae bacterium]
MDSALALRITLDNGKSVSRDEAIKTLQQSGIVKELTSSLQDKPLFYIWRIIALSEIPYARHLKYTNDLIDRIFEKLSTPFGFSLSGDEKQFLPCYNAMLVSAMCRLGLANSDQVINAIEWINNHQPMERGKTVAIKNFRFDRYGGCFENTPCYIGVAKSVFALFDYQQQTGDQSVKQKLAQGIEYLLQHQLVKRLHQDKPITSHMLDISFPESYHINIVELIRFCSRANLLSDNRTNYAVKYLKENETEDGWKVSYRYRADGYTPFDKGRKAGHWVSYIIRNSLNGKKAHAS